MLNIIHVRVIFCPSFTTGRIMTGILRTHMLISFIVSLQAFAFALFSVRLSCIVADHLHCIHFRFPAFLEVIKHHLHFIFLAFMCHCCSTNICIHGINFLAFILHLLPKANIYVCIAFLPCLHVYITTMLLIVITFYLLHDTIV